MSTWQTLRSLDELDVICIILPPFCNVGTVLLAMLLVSIIVRCLRCRKIAGPIVLKVRPTKLQAVALCFAAITMALVLCMMTSSWLMMVRLITPGSSLLIHGSLPPEYLEQLASMLLPVLVFGVMCGLSTLAFNIVLLVCVFRSGVIYEHGIAVLANPPFLLIPWSRIRRAVWWKPNTIRIDLDNGCRQLSVHTKMVGQVTEAIGRRVEVVDHDTFKATGKKACPRPRYRFQFSLRTLMLVTLLVAIFSADMGTRLQGLMYINSVREQLVEKGAFVSRLWLMIFDVGWDQDSPRQPTDDDLSLLKELGCVSDVRIYGPQVTDEGLRHLGTLTSLQMLWIDNTSITDKGLEHLVPLPRLWLLSLKDVPITNSGLARLAELPKLENLILDNTKITGKGLGHLALLKSLTSLSLINSSINDEDLKQIGKLKNLKHLRLDGTQITDAGLKHLEGLENLEYLSLENTKVTNKGLTHLKRLLALRSVRITGTAATTAAAETVLPNVRIEFSPPDGPKEDEPGDEGAAL